MGFSGSSWGRVGKGSVTDLTKDTMNLICVYMFDGSNFVLFASCGVSCNFAACALISSCSLFSLVVSIGRSKYRMIEHGNYVVGTLLPKFELPTKDLSGFGRPPPIS